MMMVMMMMNGMRKSREKSDLDFQMSVSLHHCFNDDDDDDINDDEDDVRELMSGNLDHSPSSSP